MKLESLRELFIEELEDLYSGEKMIIKALPKMASEASTPELKRAFEEHLRQTEGHVKRLDQIFDQLEKEDKDIDREDKKCKGIEGIIKEGEELIKKDAEPEVRDAGLIAAAQRVEHYEIAAYGTVRTYANLLGRSNFAQLLEKTLEEEKETDQLLNTIASRVNIEAKAA
jgi:ferritin-like metal-binding protein YciE